MEVSSDEVLALLKILGAALASYGALREALYWLAKPRAYGEGRHGEGPFGGAPPRWARGIVRLGVVVRLLPKDRELTLTDRRRNAAAFLCGLSLTCLAWLLERVLR